MNYLLGLEKATRRDIELSPSELLNVKINRYLRWFVRIRWLVSLVIILAGIFSRLYLILPESSSKMVLITGASLFLVNFLFYIKNIGSDYNDNSRGYVVFVFLQILTDFTAITFLYFSLPSFYIIFILFYSFHIVLGSIFLKRSHSLIICIAAILFISIPVLMRYNTLVERTFSSMLSIPVSENSLLVFLFNFGLIFYLVGIWYLASEMALNISRYNTILFKQYSVLKKMDKEKNWLTVRATHELKSPFAAIKSYLFTLRDGYCGELTEKAQDVIGKIIGQCDNLTDKITDIIRLSNLKTSLYLKNHFTDIDLVPVVMNSVEESSRHAGMRNIKITTSLLPRALMNGNREQLQTMMMNLIVNAVNYSHDNGMVSINLKDDNNSLILEIVDNGIGITEKALEHIFEEYYRSSEAMSHNRSGNGLGLAIVQEIIKLHNGRLEIESTPGSGSCFRVYLSSLP